MAVLYRLAKNNNQYNPSYGKWYAQSVMTETVDTDALATIMQRNCTVKKSDVLAVLEELVEVMRDQMQDSKRVKLDGFGSFKIGIESKGAQTAGKYSVAEHVKGLHVVFMPERTTDSGGNKSKQFLQGCRVEELPLNTVEKEEEPEP